VITGLRHQRLITGQFDRVFFLLGSGLLRDLADNQLVDLCAVEADLCPENADRK
jgi:hypothetical protein